MDRNSGSKSSDSLEWVGEDEDEYNSNFVLSSSCSNSKTPVREASASYKEASTSAGSHSNLISHFVGMGFSKSMVAKAIKENGEGNSEAILETLLTYSVVEKSPLECELIPSDTTSSENKMDDLDQLSDVSSCMGDEETTEHLSDKDKKFLQLVDMGFPIDDASSALEKCGPDALIMELMDFISAAQIGKITDAQLHPISDEDEPGPSHFHIASAPDKKRKLFEAEERWQKKIDSWRRRQKESYKGRKSKPYEDEESVRLPKLMTGFGVPNMQMTVFHRKIPSEAIGPPYFYFENVALTPKGVWETMTRFLYEIEPEFVDSMYFCATARKRGYIHNLPIQNRFPLQPIPPLTIQETFPLTKRWWPSWDKRTKLNCINTCTASAKLTERIKKALESWEGEPHPRTQKYVLHECKKWNLVWVGKNRAAPLEPEEIEMLLGYPKHHTRGGGTSRTERFKALGNSFQVDTVAFHLSVLKKMFPNGISVLSLFSGIGGAEVALHRLGIPLKNVVSVEISEVNKNILQSWWEQTNQKGNLIHVADVQQLSIDKLEELIKSFGGFDLIIGGSPCNNLTGSNRVSRDGLKGEHSILFYEYFRVLNDVKVLMGKF